MNFDLHAGDALVVSDIQVDFTVGSLAVPGARDILPRVNEYAALFSRAGLPIIATRDWHPPDHTSFVEEGGPWPVHCVADTPGAAFDPALRLTPDTFVVSKATHPDREAYSAFDGTELDTLLRRIGAHRLFVCGLATEYCVLETVHDALRLRYAVVVLTDAIRAIDPHPEFAEKTVHAMLLAGAEAAQIEEIAGPVPVDG